MKRLPIDFSKTNSFSPIFLDYISGKESLTPFYQCSPEISSFRKIIEDKSKVVTNRKVLVDVLKTQNAKLQTSPQESVSRDAESLRTNVKLSETIDSLLSEKTFTVTTGHQLCIFTGPLYSVYKILTTIKLARELKRSYPESNFVPVFWMVTEDHDFEEIDHVNIFGKELKWNAVGKQQPLTGKVATGKLNCEGLNMLIDELKAMLGESDHANYLLNLFRTAYNEKSNLADATRHIIHELFGQYGLVILDANDRQLKKQFSQVVKEELLQSPSFKFVNETLLQLKLQYNSQVNPREINLFYLNSEGERNRIVKEGNGNYTVLNSDKKFSEAEIIAESENYPERFSPNVVLRPLYQEMILPNVAYIGGPSEISYWLEYKRMFDHFKVNFPVLVPRNCMMWLDSGSFSKLEKLSIKPEEIFVDTDSLIKILLARSADGNFSIKEEMELVEKLFASLGEKVNAIDVTLKSNVEAEKQKQLNVLKSIEEKVIRAQKKKYETSVARVRKLKEILFPEDMLQERFENFIPYYLKYGAGYFDLLLDNFDAIPKQFLILQEEN